MSVDQFYAAGFKWLESNPKADKQDFLEASWGIDSELALDHEDGIWSDWKNSLYEADIGRMEEAEDFQN